jgi:hypothetical protein
MQLRYQLLALILPALAMSQPASAAEKWVLTTADFRSQPVEVHGLDAAGVNVADVGSSQTRVVPAEQFLDLRRSGAAVAAPANAKFVLYLTGGDKLVGEPTNLTADNLVWKNSLLGDYPIATASLRGITRSAAQSPAEQGREDVVSLSNGDVVRGIIASLSNQTVTVQVGGANSDVPLSSVASISFAATPGADGPKHGFRVRFDDGSSIVVTDAKFAGGNLSLGTGKPDIPLAQVVAIEQVNGPVSWLSSRAPTEAVSYPFVGPARPVPAYMDRAYASEAPIQFKDETFSHGIAVHAYSKITWPLDGSYAAFRTRFAVDGDSPMADVTVRIRLDDKVIFEQKHVSAGTLSEPVIRELGSARTLTFEVDGSAGFAQDSLDWIEPALLKTAPAK